MAAGMRADGSGVLRVGRTPGSGAPRRLGAGGGLGGPGPGGAGGGGRRSAGLRRPAGGRVGRGQRARWPPSRPGGRGRVGGRPRRRRCVSADGARATVTVAGRRRGAGDGARRGGPRRGGAALLRHRGRAPGARLGAQRRGGRRRDGSGARPDHPVLRDPDGPATCRRSRWWCGEGAGAAGRGSDAVFAAVAAAAWLADGLPPRPGPATNEEDEDERAGRSLRARRAGRAVARVLGPDRSGAGPAVPALVEGGSAAQAAPGPRRTWPPCWPAAAWPGTTW